MRKPENDRGSDHRQIDFSIIVPVFNRQAYLAAAIDSISKQTYDSYEIVVIDDGSTDETASYVERLAGNLISTIRQENQGVSLARNSGAKIARGKYLVFLDSDDVLFPWALQCYSDVISRCSPSVISARTLEFRDRLPFAENFAYEAPIVTMFSDYLASAGSYSFVGASCIIVDSSIFARSNGFTPDMDAAEDYDLLLRLGLDGPFAKIEEPVTVGYRAHAGNVSKKVLPLARGSSQLLAREFEGVYPGGSKRALDRITVIGRVVRPVILSSLRQNRVKEAWHLYRKSFRMHVRALRIRFLFGVGFLLLCAFSQEAKNSFSRSRLVR